MRTFIVVVYLLAFGVIASAAVAKERDHSLVPGAWAIQFELEDNIGLKAYDGMTIALKRQRSENSAVRFGTRLDLNVSDGESGARTVGFPRSTRFDHSYTQSPGGTVERSTESESTQWSVGAVATAGTEWFATSYLSFDAEYRDSVRRLSSDSSTTRETLSDTGIVSRQTSSNDGSGWEFDGVQVLFGLSAYF